MQMQMQAQMHMHMHVQTRHFVFQSWGGNLGSKTSENVSCVDILAVRGIYYPFYLTNGFRNANVRPSPIPDTWLWSTLEVCPILSFWHKAGVEIQHFWYVSNLEVQIDCVWCHAWGPERCQMLCWTYILDSPNPQLLALTRCQSPARPSLPKSALLC